MYKFLVDSKEESRADLGFGDDLLDMTSKGHDPWKPKKETDHLQNTDLMKE